MTRAMSRGLVVIALSAVSMLTVADAAHAQVRVGGWSLRANGQVAQNFQYAGPCPVDLRFDWGLVSPRPDTAVYAFQRSDMSHTSNRGQTFIPQANRSVPVYFDWRLGAKTPRFANFTGWVELRIQAPNGATKRIDFTLHCQ